MMSCLARAGREKGRQACACRPFFCGRSRSQRWIIAFFGTKQGGKDCFEENATAAFEAADALRLRGVLAILLHDASTGNAQSRSVFEEIARRTGGACLDFYGAAPGDLRDIFEAVAVLAYGGVKLLEERKKQLPGARRLLPLLD